MATTKKAAATMTVGATKRGWVWMRDHAGMAVKVMDRHVETFTADRGFTVISDKEVEAEAKAKA